MPIFDQPSVVDTPAPQQAPQQAARAPQQPKADFGYGPETPKGPDAGMVAQVNAGLGNRDASDEVAEAMRFSEDEIRIAEEILFKGYGKNSYPIMGGRHSVEILTSNPIEIDLVDEIINEIAYKASQIKEGEGVPVSVINNKQKLLTMATYFIGVDGRDLCSDIDMQLETIRSGVQAMKAMLMSGDVVKLKETKATVKEMLNRRADYINSTQNTIVLDAVSSFKMQFETMVTNLLDSKDLIPK